MTIIKKIVHLFLISITFNSCNQIKAQESFIIKGILDTTVKTEEVILVTQNNEVQDTVQVDSGNFIINGRVTEPINAAIIINAIMIKFPLVNDEIDIRIMDPVKKEYKISYKESQINNNLQSYYQKESEDYINKYKLFEEQIVNSKDENHKYELMVSEDSLAVSFVKQLTHKYLTISDKSGLSIIINDLTKLIGTRNHPDEILKLFELLSVKEQEGFYGSGIKTYLEQTNKIAFGQKINFDFIDINSKLHSINEFEGKFVLLEFWASWCGPCLSQIPFLKEIAKNSDKIQLISISIDDDLNNWRSKVESLKMDWINIHCKQSNIDLKNEFFITTVPFNILISNEGKIVGKDIPINDLMKLLN